jgi:hypothetical protein
MDPIRIFYSWQSDRDRDVCGRFVGIALQAALDTLQPSVEPPLVLDSDTAGVAGTPPVSETILAKIRGCDLFVGDVSFVGETPRGKLLPNPNVMTEFGYARSVLDDQQIILVMNTAFGPERDLPFDLAHLRHPLAYSLEDGAADGVRRQLRAAFAERLAPSLAASINVVLARRRDAKRIDTDTLGPAYGLLAQLEQRTNRGDTPTIVSGPRLVLRVASVLAANEPYLEPARVKAARPLFVPDGYERTFDTVDTQQWANFDPPRNVGEGKNPEARWYTRLARPGVLETVIMVGARIDDDRSILVEGRPLEGRIFETARRLAAVASKIGLDGPLIVSASLHGLEDVQLSTATRASRPLRIPGLFLGNLPVNGASAISGKALRPIFDAMWLGSGFDDGSPSFQTGEWQGESGDRLYEPATIGGRAWR